MLYQKKSVKLELYWKRLFVIKKFAGSYNKSYKIRQIGNKLSKKFFIEITSKSFYHMKVILEAHQN